jgi:uncharacterized protein YacL
MEETIMKTIALIVMVAILLEALVEYGKTIDHMVSNKEYKTAITQGITIVLGIALAFIFKLHLFNGAMSEFYEGLSINGTIDMILTGILFSRGANYFSDFVSRLTKKDVELIEMESYPEGYLQDDEEAK